VRDALAKKSKKLRRASARLKEAKSKRAAEFIAVEQADQEVSQSRKKLAATHDAPNGGLKQPDKPRST
jgi:hypothetical protein